MRYLAVCEGGNVRSVAMAYHLKEMGEDALAAGVDTSTEDTMKMLCDWADVIIVMTQHLRMKLPNSAHGKIKVCEVGDDVYGDSQNPKLNEKIKRFIQSEI